MRKVRVRNGVAPGPAGQPVSADGWNGRTSELALAAEQLLSDFAHTKAGRTYVLRLIGVYTVISELGTAAFFRHGYSSEQTSYFIKRLQATGTLPAACRSGLPRSG